jgi:hypothetical protein
MGALCPRRMQPEEEEEPETLTPLQVQRQARRSYLPSEHAEVRRVFFRTVRSIIALFSIRRRWARTGQLLRQQADLFRHTERIGGVLRRRR